MKNKFSSFLLLVALLFPLINKAQTTCATAQIVAPLSPLMDININQSFISADEVNWYKIPVYKDSIDLQLILALDSFVFKAYKIEVFSGVCSDLALLKKDSISNTTDSVLNISLNNLSANDSLFLKISITKNSNCDLCILKTASFKLLVNYVNSPQWECLTCTTMTGCNLVCNGDFEQHLGLFSTLNNITDACGWDDLTNSTCDYYNTSIVGWSDVTAPCNALGYEFPHSGQGYAGFLGVGTNTDASAPDGWNEYLKTKLLHPLIAGETYTLSFWLSMAEGSRIQSNTIGAYLYSNLNGINTNITTPIAITPPPQLIFNTSGLSSNGWTQFTATYTPTTSGIEWLTIGAFTTNYTSRSCNASCANTSCLWASYFFIDDISLTGKYVENTQLIQSCTGRVETVTTTLPPTVTWFNGSHSPTINIISSGATYTVTTNTGCPRIEIIDFINNIPANETLTFTPMSQTICLGETVAATASGLSNGYIWGGVPPGTTLYTPSISFTPTATGTYGGVVAGIAANGCRTPPQYWIAHVVPDVEAIINTSDLTMCNNSLFKGAYTAAPQASGATYSWAITINGVPHTDFTTSTNGQSIVVDWSNVYGGANNAQICLTVDNGSCSRSTCIDVNKCCDVPRDQYIFASNEPNYFNANHNNETVIVAGNFTASSPAQFVNCNITFTEGSKITEQTNDLLVFINCHLNTCSGMWKGIEMMPSCSLRVADCLVEDAETFAKANASCGVDFFNNVINRCATGLDLTNFAGGNGIVKGGTFTCRENIPFPFYNSNSVNYLNYLNSFPLTTLHQNTIGLNNQISQYGVKTEGVSTSQLLLRRGNGTYSHILVIFDNHETGIYAKNSGFKLHGVYYNKCGENGTTQTYLQNIRGGLVIDKSPKYNSNPLMEVGDNTQYNENYFIDCLNGIHCTGSENINVLKNKFERISETAIYMQNGTNAFTANIKNNKFIDTKKYGIHMFINSSIKANIFENRFDGANTTNSLDARAILLQEFNLSNTSRFIVYNNYISEFKTSIVAEQITNKSNIYENQIFMKNDNTPFDFQFGILLANSNFTKIVDNQITASVNTNEPVRWWQHGIYNSYSPNTYIACNFISGPDVSLTCQGPTPVTIVNNTFKNPNFAGFWLHTNGIAGPQGNSTVPSDNKWQYTNTIVNTYNPFQAFTNAGTNGNSSTFYYRNQGQYVLSYSIADISNIPLSTPIPTGFPYILDSPTPPTQCSYTPTPTYRANINNNMAQKTIKAQLDINNNIEKTYYQARKALYNTLTLDSVGTINDTVITNFKNNAANYNMGKLLETDLLINQGLINDDNAILTQAEQTNNILSIESIDLNQKEVNEIFIRYAKNNNHFNPADKQRLKQLAALCPETDGTAIYQARTLVSKFDNTTYYNECELIDPTLLNTINNRVAKQLITDLTTNSILNVYPNPTENEIFIESDVIKESDIIEIMIYSSIGSLTKKIDYTGVSTYKVDVSDLKNGTYLYKIKLNGIIMKSDKLIIIK